MPGLTCWGKAHARLVSAFGAGCGGGLFHRVSGTSERVCDRDGLGVAAGALTRWLIEPGDHREPRDLALLEGVEERVVVLERDAAVRLAVGAEHVGVRQDAGA